MTRYAEFLTASASFLWLAACGSPATSAAAVQQANALATAPGWVTGDCHRQLARQLVICGVGEAPSTAIESQAKNLAIVRGSTEIAQLLKLRISSILTDYQRVNGGIEQRVIDEISDQLADMSLSDARLAERWSAPDGTCFVLMTLEIDDFRRSLQDVFGIAEPARQALLQNAQKAFDVHRAAPSRS